MESQPQNPEFGNNPELYFDQCGMVYNGACITFATLQ